MIINEVINFRDQIQIEIGGFKKDGMILISKNPSVLRLVMTHRRMGDIDLYLSSAEAKNLRESLEALNYRSKNEKKGFIHPLISPQSSVDEKDKVVEALIQFAFYKGEIGIHAFVEDEQGVEIWLNEQEIKKFIAALLPEKNSIRGQ